MLNNSIKSNPYLTYLTSGESDLGWLWRLLRRCLYLWIGSSLLIQSPIAIGVFSLIDTTVIIGFPLSILSIIILVEFFLRITVRLVFIETQKEQFTLLQLSNLSTGLILVSLVLAVIYRTRHWITGIFGGLPFWIWAICLWYRVLAPGDGLRFFTTLLGHTYFYQDGPTYPSMLLEVSWFLSLTMSVLGLIGFALLCIVGFTIKTKNSATYIATIPLLLLILN